MERRERPGARSDDAVSAVLGAILMLALMMTLVPGAIMLRAAVSEEMDAQREAAERAAWCARRVDIGPPACPERGPMPGYSCTEVDMDVWVCGREAGVAVPTAVPTGVVTPVLTSPVAATLPPDP